MDASYLKVTLLQLVADLLHPRSLHVAVIFVLMDRLRKTTISAADLSLHFIGRRRKEGEEKNKILDS